MAIENDPSARIQFLNIGSLLAPGSCYVCGSGTCEEGYLDFGTFVDYHGSFYLCMTCFKQAAELLGFFTALEAEHLNKQNEELLAHNKELEQKLEEAIEYGRSLNVVLRDQFSNGSGPDSASDAVQAEPVQSEPDPNPLKRNDSGESEPTEPTPSPGRKHSSRTKPRYTS